MADAVWYCAVNGERKGPFSEQQVSGLLAADVITAHSKVWSPDLPDWTPLHLTALRSLLAGQTIGPPALPEASATAAPRTPDPAPVPSVSPPPSQPASPSQPAQASSVSVPPRPAPSTQPVAGSSRGLANAAITLLLISAGLSAIQVIVLGLAPSLAQRIKHLEAFSTFPLLLVVGGAGLAGGIVFLCWKYRSTVNLVQLRGPQSVTPAGAVYWYFVPIAWFWKPFEAMQNLVRGFARDGRSHTSLPVWWWIATWGGILIPIIALAIVGQPGVFSDESEFSQYVNVHILGDLLAIVSSLVTVALVDYVSKQEELALRAAS